MKKIATIGFFDGVHKGHRFLFAQLQSIAAQHGWQVLLITFDTHPRAVLHRTEEHADDFVPRLLTSQEERTALLRAYGEVAVLPFSEVQPLTAAQFMEKLRDEYDVAALLMGYDHMFGSDRLHHPQEYRRIGEQTGVEVLNSGEYIDGELHVSSTEIRQALESGNIVVANELLGRPYSLTGIVTHGKGIGRTIGFPTANIQPFDPLKIIPRTGVYHVRVTGDGCEKEGICNIGTNPTIGNSEQTIEVHLPGWQGNLYGQTLALSFLRFIREERKFRSLQALQEQITEDVASITLPHNTLS